MLHEPKQTTSLIVRNFVCVLHRSRRSHHKPFSLFPQMTEQSLPIYVVKPSIKNYAWGNVVLVFFKIYVKLFKISLSPSKKGKKGEESLVAKFATATTSSNDNSESFEIKSDEPYGNVY
jgi:hypothetical protein